MRSLTGKCECGAVEYRVEDDFEYALNCHCQNCRAATGSAFKPVGGIRREHLEVTRGGDRLSIVGEETDHNARCGACGSLLYSVVRDGEYVHVALGSLVDGPTLRPTAHIWVSQKAPWYEIADDLPQYAEFPT
jgi:hypothetical protein